MRRVPGRRVALPALMIGLVGCLHGNNAPSGGIDVRVTTDATGFVVSWPAGGAIEVQVGRCVATCAETEPSDPTSEFSELVPAPEFAELTWHVLAPSGAAPPLRLGLTPAGGSVLVPYTAPMTDTGAWAVFVVVESMRAQELFTQTGVARLN